MRTSTPLRVGGARARGLTLIELLVSLAIGLVLMVAVVAAYIGSAGATRAAEAQGRMNEDGQAALAILAQQIRMAGNNPKRAGYDPETPSNPVFGTGTFMIRACDGKFSDITTAADLASLTCATGGSDSIGIAYEADQYNTIRNSGNLATDCLGQTLTSVVTKTVSLVVTASPFTKTTQTVSFALADNRFYVGTTTTITTPSLYCKGNGGTNSAPQPLVENVEDLQFTFGTSVMGTTSTASLAVKGYLTATELAALTATDDAERWSRVLTVRICALVRSENPVAPDLASAQYVKCDGTVEDTPPDLRLRRAYSTTVVLRNRASTD